MQELLNRYGLPNEIGFDIVQETIEQWFDEKEDFEELMNTLSERLGKILKQYGFDPNLNIFFYYNFSIQSNHGDKSLIVDEFHIINSIYKYFNGDDQITEHASIHFDHARKQEYITEEIRKLKHFVKGKLMQLNTINNIEELKDISTQLYKDYLNAYNESDMDILVPWEPWFKNEISRDAKAFKKAFSNDLQLLIKQLSKMVSDDKLFDKVNPDKFKLYLAYQYTAIGNCFKEPYHSLLLHSVMEILDDIEDKNVLFETLGIFERDGDDFSYFTHQDMDYNTLKNALEEYLKNPKAKIALDTVKKYREDNTEKIDYTKVFDDLKQIIEDTIKQSNEMGFEDVSFEELTNSAKEQLKSEQSPEKQLQLKSYIDRAEFYYNQSNVYKAQKGKGLFKNSIIIFFDNGIVAVDKLNGDYGYLYIMPINTYLEILKDNNIKNLMEVRNRISVTPVSHRKLNWKEEAYNIINDHYVTKEEATILESIKGIELPVNPEDIEALKQMYKDNEYVLNKINEKEEERNNKYEEIDNELRSKDTSSYDDEKEKSEENLIKDAEAEILENCSQVDDLTSIFDYETKIKTVRNPKVSLDTKLRTRCQNGAMRCERCGKYESLDTRNFETHHIIALSEGGIDNVYNTVCLCGDCHNKIHSKIPFTFAEKWKMLMNVRENILKTTPQYVERFDRLFNPYYNALYNSEIANEEELIDQYIKEEEYYLSHKEEEDNKFLAEWNSVRR